MPSKVKARRRALACAVVCATAALAPGCIVVSLAATEKSWTSGQIIDSRVTSHKANAAGDLCYVDERVRRVSLVYVAYPVRIGAGVGTLGAGLAAAGLSGTSQTVALALFADSALALLYSLIRNSSVDITDSWQRTKETRECSR